VRKLKYLFSAFLVASLLAIPATAQKHAMGRMGRMGQRNNSGPGEPHGQARAEEVQNANKKGDKDRKASKGNNGRKTRTRKGWKRTRSTTAAKNNDQLARIASEQRESPGMPVAPQFYS
jgi:hypothetical protein